VSAVQPGESFDSVLVANRGEIAVRVMRTLRRLGVRSIAVYSDADAEALHVRLADDAVRLGPPEPAQSYLSIERVIAAVERSGAAAVHPGYGFLSENAAFARAVSAAGAVWIGPPPDAIEAMGDKVRAKATVAAAGVPVVPGSGGRGLSDTELAAAAEQAGYPVLLKPSAGGGGKGMHLVTDAEQLGDALQTARREARTAFGDDTLLLERYVRRPRHIEVQVFADTHGGAVHLGERECSLQRRHQKIVEEAPSPLLDESTRRRIGQSAVDAARACGYVGAGTVEFIVSADRPDEFFFLEMNTRLQVEHPVTEEVTGLDLVELQLRVAAGDELGFTQDEVQLNGHAIEARVYAEDPDRGFLPTGGRVLALREPADRADRGGWDPHVRVDSGITTGSVVGSAYDPMLAKVVGYGRDRATALRFLDRALAGTVVLGLGTNVGFLRRLLVDPAVVAGDLDTDLVTRFVAAQQPPSVPDGAYLAAALCTALRAARAETGTGPWDAADGWRVGERAWSTYRFQVGDAAPVVVTLRTTPTGHEARVGDGAVESVAARVHDDVITVLADTGAASFLVARDGDILWLGRGGETWAVRRLAPYPRARRAGDVEAGGTVHSPMPGTVLALRVAAGDRVRAGQPLVVVEAMKMEHVVVAPFDGGVATLHVNVGEQVALDAPLAVVVPDPCEESS
jgi:acetyl-CoA/propionyl-CoA carboxylase biotin carboxyl carrier protein